MKAKRVAMAGARLRKFRSGARTTRRFMLVYVVNTASAFISIGFQLVFWKLELLADFDPAPNSGENETLSILFAIDDLLFFIVNGSHFVSLYFFIAWNYRVVANLRTFVPTSSEKIWPSLAVIWWFIPIANLFMTYRSVKYAWRSSQQSAIGTEINLKWPVLTTFWVVWIVGSAINLGGTNFYAMLMEAGLVTGGASVFFYVSNFTSIGLQIWACFLAWQVMSQIDDLQLQSHQATAFT